jgi:hypothetical protein
MCSQPKHVEKKGMFYFIWYVGNGEHFETKALARQAIKETAEKTGLHERDFIVCEIWLGKAPEEYFLR